MLQKSIERIERNEKKTSFKASITFNNKKRGWHQSFLLSHVASQELTHLTKFLPSSKES